MSRERDEIRASLGANVEALARELVPDGRRAGAYWLGRSPLRDDKHAGSFWIALRAPFAWRDEGAGEGGDLFQLIGRVCDHKSFPETLDWCRKWLGLAAWKPGERERRIEVARQQSADADAADAARREEKRGKAEKWFRAAKVRPFVGSVADLYLRTRGIDVQALPRLPGVLGWLPEWPHSETGTKWPVMVALMQHCVTRRPMALHLTFLKPDGSGKAPLFDPKSGKSTARNIWGSPKGAVIRLWRGASGMPEDVAAKHGLREGMVLGEGVEDGGSAMMGAPNLRIWCTGTLGNLAEVVLPECCDEVTVMKDNDWGKPQAAAAFDRGIVNLLRQGKTVKIASSHIGKDANDALRGGVA